MKTYKEVKEIAKYVSQIRTLTEKLKEADYCFDDIDWGTAEFVRLSEEDIENFKKNNCVTEDYYVEQHTGYFEDDFYGWLWFKTDIEGEYVKVHFCC